MGQEGVRPTGILTRDCKGVLSSTGILLLEGMLMGGPGGTDNSGAIS